MFFVWYKKLNDYQKMLLISFSPGPSGFSIQRHIYQYSVVCTPIALLPYYFLLLRFFIVLFKSSSVKLLVRFSVGQSYFYNFFLYPIDSAFHFLASFRDVNFFFRKCSGLYSGKKRRLLLLKNILEFLFSFSLFEVPLSFASDAK